MNLNEFIEKITKKEPFAFARWGDGEFLNVNKSNGANCDGNIYYEDLGDALLEILNKRQTYLMGCQTSIPYSVRESKKYNQNWINADVFHEASMNGILDKFIEALDNSYITYIGNETLKSLPFIDEFIEIPYNNVWLKRDEILDEIQKTFTDEFKVYCFSAGMATNYFIDYLWNINKNNIYIDVGSVFDPYVGRYTRSYHKKLKNLIRKDGIL